MLLWSCSGPSPEEPVTSGGTAAEVARASSTAITAAPANRTTGSASPSTLDASSTSAVTEAATEETVSAATSTTADPVSDPIGSPTTSGPAGATGETEPVDEARESASPGVPDISVLDAFPHDPDAFTQGLVLHDGRFYESTGLYGSSTIRIVVPETGETVSSVRLDDRYFGEGLEVVGDRVVQLTWKEETAFIWDAETLEPLGSYTYRGEGWGLCAFEDRFVMSDGSSRLTYRDLETFEVLGGVDVLLSGEPVEHLNELECVGDLVYANVWFSDEIVVIASDSGRVIARVDASPLRDELSADEGTDVLNGIAHDPDRRVFYLTGKLWPEIFEVRIGTDP